jgi:predicted membrane channel-forming protein YqfA (hemolysin III family)
MTGRFNTPLWSGLVLTFVAVFSYLFLFINWPATRDVPWVTFLLFALALLLVVIGLKNAQRKIVPSIVLVLSIGVMAFFTFGTMVFSKQIPPAQGAPAIGQKVPDFTLPDTNHQNVALAQLVSAPGAKGALLIFYRGYW